MNIIKHRRLFPLDKDVLSELSPLSIISDTNFRINGAAQFIVCYQGTCIMHRPATFLWCIYQVHYPHYPIYHSSYPTCYNDRYTISLLIINPCQANSFGIG